MLRYLSILFLFFSSSFSNAEIKDKIIQNLKNTDNIDFKFEQNINGKIEKGNCVIEYPRKIYCEYAKSNNKILVSNGKSLVIKTNRPSYYHYPLDKTPLNYILDKKFLIDEIKSTKERIVDGKFINFKILKEENVINIFFDNKNFNLIGWQTIDVYQNLNITYIHSLKINQILERNTFVLPKQN